MEGIQEGKKDEGRKRSKRQAASISQSVGPAHKLANQAYMILKLSTVLQPKYLGIIFITSGAVLPL